MNKEEEKLFKVLDARFYEGFDRDLHRMEYTKGPMEEYDPYAFTKFANSSDRQYVKSILETMPRPVSLKIVASEDLSGTYIFFETDRVLRKVSAVDNIVAVGFANCMLPNIYETHNIIGRAIIVPPKHIRLFIEGAQSFDQIIKALGLPASEFEEDEDIEVDLDDPLSLDFPDPDDKE